MPKIWIDISNVPHVLFFKNIIHKLEQKNEVLVTARDYGPVIDLLKQLELPFIKVGKHGGKELEGKLIESMKRIIELTEIIAKEKPELAVCKSSVELCRVAFGLSIPIIEIADNDKSKAVNKLTFPLATRIITPNAIDKKLLMEDGATFEKIVQFYGVCELANISDFSPNRKVLDDLGINEKKPLIILRFEPVFAAYLKKASPLLEVLKLLKEKIENKQFVLFPRTPEQAEIVRKIAKEAIIPERVVDTLSLLNYATLMVGAGGTMNRESALLGVPTISCYPGKLLAVDKFLIEKSLMFYLTNPIEILKFTQKLIQTHEQQKQFAGKVILSFENPIRIPIKLFLIN